jgi:hypothetical protein
MTSILSTLLFKHIPPQTNVGRSIKFDASDPDIRFASGPMHDRVLGYLMLRDEPLTAKEIAQGIGSTTSRVYVPLKRLVTDRVLEIISVEGFHPEYVIRQRR